MKTIAIVEDNPDNMLLARIMLEGLYVLDEYTNGTDALKGIPENPPNLILMDISLPDIDGVTVMLKLRDMRNLKHIPMLALTAHAMRGDRERFLAAGFDYYIAKPVVSAEILQNAVNRFMNDEVISD